MKEHDIDGNGTLDLEEFSNLVDYLTFQKFDADGSGSIDMNELKDACKSLGYDVDKAKLQKIL
jgi:Ca2+-binding EF-hand superfamily protein